MLLEGTEGSRITVSVLPGHETKAMMNNSGPRSKRSQLERRLNTDILCCVVLLLAMCLTAAVGERGPGRTGPSCVLTADSCSVFVFQVTVSG